MSFIFSQAKPTYWRLSNNYTTGNNGQVDLDNANYVNKFFANINENSHLEFNDNQLLDFYDYDDFTVEFSIRINNIGNNGVFISNNDISLPNQKGFYVLILPDGKLSVSISDSVLTFFAISTQSIDDGNFHFITITFQKNTDLTIYIDGVLDKKVTIDGIGDFNSPLKLYVNNDGTGNNQSSLNFDIWALRFWSKPLFNPYITFLSENTVTGNEENLITALEITNGNFNNIVGDDIEVTPQGIINFNQENNIAKSQFFINDGYINIPDTDFVTVDDSSYIDGSGSLTFEVRFRRPAIISQACALLANRQWISGKPGLLIGLVFNGTAIVTNLNDGTSGFAINSPNSTINEWIHVASVLDRQINELILYIDGIEVANTDITSIGDITSPEFPHVGTDASDTYNFDGDFSMVRIWDHARTASQINNNMNVTLTGNEKGLLTSLDFTNSSISDISKLKNPTTKTTNVTFATGNGLCTRKLYKGI